jgi:ribose transport system substrate-binding protein
MTRRTLLACALLGLLCAGACHRGSRKRIAVIPKATSHLFWLSVQAGAMAASEELDVDVTWNAPATEMDHARQVQIVDSMIAQRVDGIAIAASERKALIAPVDRAMAAGIPVVVFDSGLDSTNYTSFIATDNVEAGRMAARELARLLNGRGQIAVLQHAPGSVSTMDREEGFEEVIASEFPDIEIVARQYSMSDRAKAVAVSENFFTAHPDLDGIFASTEPSASGVALALKSRELAGKVRFVAFDSSDTMIEDIRAGIIDATVVQDPFRMGFEAVKTLVDHLNGQPAPERVDLQGTVVRAPDLDDPDIMQLIRPDLETYLQRR